MKRTLCRSVPALSLIIYQLCSLLLLLALHPVPFCSFSPERKTAAHRGCAKSSAALTASGCLENFKQGSSGRQQTWCHRGQHTRLRSAGLAALAKRPGKYLGLKDQGNLFRFN